MKHSTTGRSAKTLGANDRLLHAAERLEHRGVDPQGLLTEAVVRRHIEACTCPFCGAGPFKSLPQHTNRAHGVDKHELRARAGLTSNEPISSAEVRENQRRRMIERAPGAEHFSAMGKRRAARTGVELTEAGRKKIAATITATNARHTPEERSARMKEVASRVSPESRKRQGESLKKHYAENPISAERVQKMQAGLRTPETQAKLAAASAKRRKGHGTVAEYDHHGCRCEPCRAAKRASRPGPGIRRGETHASAKLTDAQVAELRKLAGEGVKQVVLAERYGLSQGTVSQIVRNRRRVQ